MKVVHLGSYYRFFQQFIGHRLFLLSAISFVTTTVEGLGIALFFSYIQLMSTPGAVSPSSIQKLEVFLSNFDITLTLSVMLAIVIGLFVLRGLLILGQNSYHYRLYMNLTMGLTKAVARALSLMSYPAFIKKDTGEYTHISTKEVERSVTAFYQMSAIMPKMIVVMTYMIFSLKIEWRFTIAGIVFGVLVQGIFKFISTKTKKISVEMSQFESRLTSNMIQMIQGFKYLVSTSSTKAFEKRIGVLSEGAAKSGSKIGMLAAMITATSEPLIIIFLCVCIYYQTQVLQASWTNLFVAIMFLYRTMKELTVIQGAWQAFNGYSNGIDRVREFLRSNDRNEKTNSLGTMPDFKNQIVAQGLHCTLGGKSILSGVDFEIPKNKTIAFVGESGAGKSTVINLITGIIQPSSGDIQLDSASYAQLNLDLLRKKIGVVTQENVIFDGSILENVTLWQDENLVDQSKVESALQISGASTFVSELSGTVNAQVGDRGVRLSGGQRQRIALAREIYRDPEILILDEATSALDSESEYHIQKQIENLKGKVTIILVAHRLSTIKNCDYIYVLEKGKVAQKGTFDELVKREGPFSRMVNLQSLN